MNRYQGKREAPRPEPQRRPSAPAEKPRMEHPQAAGGGAAAGGKKPQKKKNGQARRALLIVGIVLAVLLALFLVARAVWNSIVTAPDIPAPDTSLDVDPDDPELTEEERLGLLEAGVNVNEELPEYISDQKEGVYTFLLIGRTDENNQADMLMLIVFDSNTGEINACSIPRDTMVNLSSDVKKINSTIWGGTNNVKNWVRKTLGVYPNFYVLVDWQAVGDLVEAVGGVNFDVPIRMHYIDTSEDGFTIDLQPGMQLLDGDKAMQLIRWRKNNVYPYEINLAKEAGFDGSDIKRTQMQQQFIVEAAKQILQVKNLKYLGSMVQVFKENVETDLSLGNLAWFAQKALELGSANKVTFHSLPENFVECYSRTQHNYQSYVTMKPSQLVSMINAYFNPYNSDISQSNLDLMSVDSDDIIHSSTGSVADSEHNRIMTDVKNGLAEIVKEGSRYNVVYKEEETEDPNASGDPTDPNDPNASTDPNNPGTVTDPENPGTATDPTNPGTTTDPENPGGTGTTDPGGTGETGGGEDAQPPAGETGDPSDPNSPNYDPWQDPNYNPDPWADQREEQGAA